MFICNIFVRTLPVSRDREKWNGRDWRKRSRL